MRVSGREMKERLMQEAEKVIDELVSWSEETGEPTFSQIEGVVLKLRQRLSEEMTRGVIESQEQVKPSQKPSCQGCGAEMRYKGLKANGVTSWVGEVKLERAYYYCAECQDGLFPPG